MILLFGDVHGKFKHVLPAVQKHKPAAVIFLGDMELSRPFEQEVAEVVKLTQLYFIHGNHDTESTLNHDCLFNSTLADRNLHNQVVEIDGYRVAGLGGVFRQSIWYPRYDAFAEPTFTNYDEFVDAELQALKWQEMRQKKKLGNDDSERMSSVLNGKRLTHKSSIFYDDWANLCGQQADILVTHEAPSCHSYGFAGITELAREMKVKRTFHGHHHDRLDYSGNREKLRFEAHGVGFCGISDETGALVRAGEYDEQRMRRSAT